MADLFDIVTARKLSGGGGGGGATVEALSVTQNGTYTAPSGKAYSPVTVNVSGGSSDFSTAEVTLNLTPPEGVSINESYLSCDFYYPSESHNYTISSSPADENNKCNIVLYRGYGYVGMIEAFDDGDNHYYLDYETASFSGGAIYDEETGAIVVTGNCTITGSLVLGD